MKILSILFSVLLILITNSSFAGSGYVLKEVLRKSTYEQVGLRAGDRIISYDGHEVNSVSDSMELYDKLKKKAVKTILIERDGQKETLTIR
jgi:type II secretory pathway component PulC